MEKGKKRLATLVGINYTKSPRHKLDGCIHDVLAIQDELISIFEFDQNNINLLTDDDSNLGTKRWPNGANIKLAINQMMDKAEEGDVLCFYFSGHGALLPNPDNADQLEDVIVPCDFNLIIDVDFRNFVDKVPKGASFTIIADACHSGGLIQNAKEQIGPSVNRSINLTTKNTIEASSPKRIPIDFIAEQLVKQLKSNTGSVVKSESLDIGSLLCKSFGCTSSLKFLMRDYRASQSTNPGLSKLLDTGSQLLANYAAGDKKSLEASEYGAAAASVKKVLDTSTSSVNKMVDTSTTGANKGVDAGNQLFSTGSDFVTSLHEASVATGSDLFKALKGASRNFALNESKDYENPDAGILLSGCQSDETSKDVKAKGPEEKAGGAFSKALRKVLKEDVSSLVSYRNVVTKVREAIREQGYMQHPCLYCSDENATAPFLGFKL